jgi:iron(III) transport system permease protein
MTALAPGRLPLGARLRGAAEPARRTKRAPWPLVVTGLVIAVAALLPLVYLVIRAAGVEGDVVAFLTRPRTLIAIGVSISLALAVGVATVLLGVPVAWLTTRTDLPWRGGWAVLTAIPLALPSYLVAFAFLGAFGPRGAVQGMLEPLGVERLPSMTGLPAAVVVVSLVTFPYVTLATRAALLRLDPAVEESARLLGDGRMATFRRVTLPAIAPAMAAGALLAMLYALADFGAVSLLQTDTLSRAIYLQLGASFDRALAAVLALVLVALVLVLVVAEARMRHRSRAWRSGSRRRLPASERLGRWTVPSLIGLAVLVGLALAVPVVTVGWWLVRGVAQGQSLRLVGSVTVDTVAIGAAAALLAVVVALPVAALGGRYRDRVGGIVNAAVLTGYALPGIVVALAMVFLATRSVPFLYQTIALLIIVYAIRFAAQPIGGLRAAMTGAPPSMEEAGRVLGDGPVRAFARLTMPYLRPSLVAGAALVFLTVIKELPLALLLSPVGFRTLATEVWDAASAGFYARAAAPAALLLLVSVASMSVLLRAEGDER